MNFDQRSQVETLQAVKAATQNSGRQLRAALTAAVQAIKDWVAGPWDVRRVAKLLALVAGIGGAGWAWREFGRGWWRRYRSGVQPGRMDPVRAEAARWLRTISDFGYRIPDSQTVTVELQRLRFGARGTWPEPEGVFRAARRAVRELRRGR